MTQYEAGLEDDSFREHEKFARTSRDGWEYVLVRCPYCFTDVGTSWTTLAWYGKSCPGCGAKHMFFGLTRKPTEAQTARAEAAKSRLEKMHVHRVPTRATAPMARRGVRRYPVRRGTAR